MRNLRARTISVTVEAPLTINLKKIAADIVAVGIAVAAVLAVLLNVANAVSLPAADIAWIIVASSVVTAIVNVARPFAASVVASVFKRG